MHAYRADRRVGDERLVGERWARRLRQEGPTMPPRGLLFTAWRCDEADSRKAPRRSGYEERAPSKGLQKEPTRLESQPRGDCVEIPIANAG